MKKFLGILILGLLTCQISFADDLKIIDGDTIVLNGEKIRFSGTAISVDSLTEGQNEK